MPIGNSIPQSLADAIRQRESFKSSENKTPDILKYAKGRSSFCVVRSIVKVNGSYDLAKSAVLSSGIGLEGRSGIDREANKNLSNSDAAYYQSDVYGFRPMPGITNVNSSVIGGMGAVRKTVISFQANSVEDLDVLNKVYMTFGALVVVEFGHTVYIDKSGNVKTMTLGDLVPNDTIFASTPNYKKIRQDLLKNTETKNHNYEGYIGKVTNFNFSVTNEGTYNCDITLYSMSQVTDSLSIPGVVDNVSNFKTATQEGEAEANAVEEVSNLVGLVTSRVKNFNAREGKVPVSEVLDDSNVKLSSLSSKFKGEHFYISRNTSTPPEGDAGPVDGGTHLVAFTTLRFWMKLFNIYAMPRRKDDVLLRLDTGGQPYTSFGKHFTLNPGMVQLPKKSSIKEFNVTSGEGYLRGNQLTETQTPDGGSYNILDIKVSLDLIKQVNDKFIGLTPKKADEIGLTDFLEELIQQVQKYLGDINTFVLATEPRSEDLAIYDRLRGQQKGALLNLTGLSTTVTDVSIKSNISNRMATAAMFSKKGGKTSTGIDKYNTDGKTEAPISGDASQTNVRTSDDDEKADDAQAGTKSIEDILKDKFEAWNRGQDNTFESCIDASRQYLKNLRGTRRVGKFNAVPVDLSITMLGTGGFRNLETFTIPDHLLPTRFGNKNFIITNVEQTIDSSTSNWQTTITGMLKPPS